MSSLSAHDFSLRYPVGDFSRPASITPADRAEAAKIIADLPKALRSAVSGLNDSQLDTPYREGGWTVRQLVHHVADSHINAYTRTRLALTEDWPTIKPYDEAKWAKLEDAKTLPVEVSLSLLEALHRRWAVVLNSLTEADWQRGYIHPEDGRQHLATVALVYSWHSQHHTAHVTELRKRMGW